MSTQRMAPSSRKRNFRSIQNGSSQCMIFAAAAAFVAAGYARSVAAFTLDTVTRKASSVGVVDSLEYGRVDNTVLYASSSTLASTPSIVTDDLIAKQSEGIYTRYKFNNNKYYTYDDEDDDDEDDDDKNGDFTTASAVSSYLDLRDSMGSDIMDTDLQKQIDQGDYSFLTSDVSELEKIAMSSITEQLPQAAVKQAAALKQKKGKSSSDTQNSQLYQHKTNANNNNVNNKKMNDLNFAKDQRVTVDVEIQLARIIQAGAALYQMKKDAELRLGLDRELTKNEWAEIAGLSSTRDLRRRISDYRKAKQDLVAANLGLVHAVVKQQWNTKYKYMGTVTREELIQEGSLGLIRAAELFDPSRGLRFSTYAVVWIKGTLQNTHVTELVKLPSREKTKWNKIVQAVKDIKGTTNMDSQPSLEELSAVTGLSVTEIRETQRRMEQAQQVKSLDYQQISRSRSGTETSVIADDKNLQDTVETELAARAQFQADLIAAMARNLDAREARLMRLRYGLSEDGQIRTLHECAEAMGVSYARVNQLAKRCLKKLREAAEAESLEEYLLTIA